MRQRTIQLSDLFQYSLVLIPKPKRLLGAGRIHCEESGTPSTIISVRDAAVRITDLSVMFLCFEIGVTFKRVSYIHIHMFSDHSLRLCISFECHGFKSSEWLPFLIKANFSIGIIISGVINWYMQNSDKNLQLQLIQLIVWKYILLSTYILPLLCLHTSINKQLQWLACIMQEMTMDRTVCQRSYEPLSEWSTCVWRLSVSSHWGNSDMHRTTFTIS